MKEGKIEDQLEKLAQIVKTKQGRLRNITEVTDYTIDDHVEIPKGRYIVEEDIIIKQKGILEIEPGTEMYFGPEAGVISYGTLKAVGTEEEKIKFTAFKDTWKNIAIAGHLSYESTLEYCVIMKGLGRHNIPKEVPFEGWSNHTLLSPSVLSFSLSDDNRSFMDKAGGGILIIGSSSPTITNCIIKNNNSVWGAGLYIEKSYLILKGNTIANNTATEGGGIYFRESGGKLLENKITKNEVISDFSSGGGVYLFKASITLRKNTISENKARSLGGGLYIHFSKPILEENIIVNNGLTDRGKGGGLLLSGESDLIMNNNTIENNWPDNIGDLRY